MTKEEILKSIRLFAKKNGHNPSIRDVTYKTKDHPALYLRQIWKLAEGAGGGRA